jgi:hypothetical protein
MRAPLPVGGLALLFVCIFASTASAQSLAGRFQLQTQASIFDFESVNYQYKDENSFLEPFNDTSRTVGLTPRLGMGLGYMVHDHISLNLSATLGVRTDEDERNGLGVELTSNRFELLPTFRVLTTGERARMFVAAGAGYLRRATKVSGGGEDSAHLGLFGGVLGIHGFVHDRVSIDAMLETMGEFGPFKTVVSSVDHYDDDEDRGTVRGYRIVFSVGLTGWLGGQASKAAPRR